MTELKVSMKKQERKETVKIVTNETRCPTTVSNSFQCMQAAAESCKGIRTLDEISNKSSQGIEDQRGEETLQRPPVSESLEITLVTLTGETSKLILNEADSHLPQLTKHAKAKWPLSQAVECAEEGKEGEVSAELTSPLWEGRSPVRRDERGRRTQPTSFRVAHYEFVKDGSLFDQSSKLKQGDIIQAIAQKKMVSLSQTKPRSPGS